jgi:hypothetical protein
MIGKSPLFETMSPLYLRSRKNSYPADRETCTKDTFSISITQNPQKGNPLAQFFSFFQLSQGGSFLGGTGFSWGEIFREIS